jgi:D-alanyl-D-alanine carboxypeptidase (penicillin-binding protein 5/6)
MFPGAYMRKLWLVLAFLIFFPAKVCGQDELYLISPSAVLVEQTTGQVLYAKNERERMYPASLTKILTALVVMDYLDPDDVITVGPEIRGLPTGYNRAIHFEGETITVRNLLRALMIPSGNQTSHVLVINTIRKKENRQNITFEEADRQFSALMNEKARSLGAMQSHFNNSYGFHSENHYTTAYDMAIISRAYMENELLAQIAGEKEYTGDSLEGRYFEGAQVQHYEWRSHNDLLRGGAITYPYATGIKTGFTDAAGFCLASSATKLGFSLVSIVLYTPDAPSRAQDSRVLLDYGFFTYAMRPIQTDGEFLTTAVITNPRLGEGDELPLVSGEGAAILLNLTQLERVRQVLSFDGEYLVEGEEAGFIDPDDNRVRLRAPIEKDTQVGVVRYILDGELLHEGPVFAAADILERSFDSDMDYYIRRFREGIFTMRGLPYWFGTVGTLVGIIGIAAAINANRKNKNRSGGYGHFRGYR